MTTKLDRLLPKLTYRVTRDDWAAFERLPAELLGWEKLYVFGPPIAAGMAVGLFTEPLRGWRPLDIDSFSGKLLLGGGLLALAHAVTVLLLSLRTRWRIAQRALPETETILDADLDGFSVTEDGSSRRFAWTSVTVIETGSHLFFCATPRDAVPVPRRAFDSPETMHLLAHTARELSAAED